MDKNMKKFVVAAVTPIFILAGLLLYILSSSTDVDSRQAIEHNWENNSGQASMHGNGRGASSQHEGWGKKGNKGSMRGKGRGRFAIQDNGDVTDQRGRGRGFGFSHENINGISSQFEHQEFPTEQRGNGHGEEHQYFFRGLSCNSFVIKKVPVFGSG